MISNQIFKVTFLKCFHKIYAPKENLDNGYVQEHQNTLVRHLAEHCRFGW